MRRRERDCWSPDYAPPAWAVRLLSLGIAVCVALTVLNERGVL